MSWTMIRLVAAREITVRLRDRAFLISTIALLVIVTASIAVPAYLNRNSDRPDLTVATVGASTTAVARSARAIGQQAIALDDRANDQEDSGSPFGAGAAQRVGTAAAPTVRLTVHPVADRTAAEQQVHDGTADAALVSTGDRVTVIGDDEVDDDLSRLITVAAGTARLRDALTAAGLTDTEVTTLARQLADAPPPGVQLLDPPAPHAGIAIALGLLFATLFFLTSFNYGLLIAQSVVEEKQSRVVELLVAAVPARVLLAGKVLGATALALGQVVVLLAVGLAGAAAAGQSAVTTLLLHSGGWFLAFFAFGFTMLACLWAAAGALCSRPEEINAATVPLQALVMIPFFLAVYISTPGAGLTALSYIPFTAPLSMPRRLLLGDAAWWEPLLAAAGIAATGVVLVLLAARLYENTLLRTGTRTSLRTAWKGADHAVTRS